ncbi:MAG: hypothetical protein BWX98_02219 [Candidatus Aminicenantes bacterium ADurb.Bin147]|nr:MAG: hypothetical protein BWX98_02219 [Candidatus Aminicenantes bacterium ADurb.Bin147]
MAGQGLDFPAPGVVAVDVELPVPVGPKVDHVPDPHRAGIVAAALGLGNFFVRQVVEVDDPDGRIRPPAVMLPLEEGVRQGVGRHLFPVGRVDRPEGVRNPELFRESAFDGNGEQLLVPAGENLPGGREQDRLPVRSEALDDVRARVPGQPPGHAAGGRDDVDVGVAVVLGAEGDQSAVGRERRIGFDAQVGRQPPDVFSVEIGRPEVIGVMEGEAAFPDGRLSHHPRVADVDPEPEGDEGGQQGGRAARSDSHDPPP